MSDTPTVPTLRELLIEKCGNLHSPEAYLATGKTVDQIEAALLAPLRKEIATLQNQVEKGSAVINRLGNTIERNDSDRAMLNVRIRILQTWVTIRDGEITHLRRKVAAADVLRGRVVHGYDYNTCEMQAALDNYDAPPRKVSVSELVSIDPDLTEGLPSETLLVQQRLGDGPPLSIAGIEIKVDPSVPEGCIRIKSGEKRYVFRYSECTVAPVETFARDEIHREIVRDLKVDNEFDRANWLANYLSVTVEDIPPAVMSHYGHVDYHGPLCGPITVTPVEKDAVALLVDATRALIYERDMAGCWRKDRADAELRNVEDVLDTHFGGSYPPPDEDEDEDTPLVVADAGETEEDASAPPTNEELDRNLVDAFVEIERQEDQLAALRRDVDAVSLEVRDATCTIVHTRDNMIYELKERIERLESRERPKPDRIEVTDAMIDAFWASWGSGELDALTRGPLRDALSAALAARDADQ